MNEAELVFTDILNCSRQSLYLDKDMLLDKTRSSLASSVLKRRMQGEPIQYILGKTEFMGLEFKVAPDVFIPRPETEILVENALRIIKSQKSKVKSLRIMDIGTGSGNIAVSLAKLLPGVEIYATDISKNALGIARTNAQLNKVENNISFFQSDLLTTYDLRLTTYDLIVSNPPYVPAAEIETLQPEVRYEPRMALDGGEDGLGFYRRIIKESPAYLKKGGFLIMEMGFDQKDAIQNIFQKSGYFEIIDLIKDYNDIDRVIIAKKRDTLSAKAKGVPNRQGRERNG